MTSSADERGTAAGSPVRAYRIVKIAAVALVVLLGIGAALLAAKWPFTRDNIAAQLGDAASSTVHIRSFQARYFPPGCVMEEVQFSKSKDAGSPPLMTVARMTITANFLGLFRGHVSAMHLEDVHVDMAQRARWERPEQRIQSFRANHSARSSSIAPFWSFRASKSRLCASIFTSSPLPTWFRANGSPSTPSSIIPCRRDTFESTASSAPGTTQTSRKPFYRCIPVQRCRPRDVRRYRRHPFVARQL